MKLSQYIAPTLKEAPSDAVVSSHVLMMRAGLIRKESAGMYAYLPLGFRVLNKIINIVREEMDASGAQECLMPELTNGELWKESGRWDTMGAEMIRVRDRNGQDYVLAPTHEEAFSGLVRSIVSSYRELPLIAYQINTKFRDEIRPRFGVIRSKEFIMKDAYSFDLNEDGLDKSYRTMGAAYRRIFKRCGLETIPVQADSGAMGGSGSEEFMVASEVGEETLIICGGCEYRANIEKAEYKRPETRDRSIRLEELTLVATPNVRTIEDDAAFFKCGQENFLKSIIYIADGRPIMAVVPGDREINEPKLKNTTGCTDLAIASEEAVLKAVGAEPGSVGPVNAPSDIDVICDLTVEQMSNAITGANKTDFHYSGVNPIRDFKPAKFADITSAAAGDLCPKCGASMYAKKGIEVGHIFKLGSKYTRAMNVTVLNEKGESVTPVMGSYGIGVTRTLAAVVEQHFDERGIIWPASLAPFDVHLVGLGRNDDELKASEEVYKALKSMGFEVLYDDRKASPGSKFADADLLGMPVRVTVGKTFFAQGALEIKNRKTGETAAVKPEAAADIINKILGKENENGKDNRLSAKSPQ